MSRVLCQKVEATGQSGNLRFWPNVVLLLVG
jgi:hypothetical protein